MPSTGQLYLHLYPNGCVGMCTKEVRNVSPFAADTAVLLSTHCMAGLPPGSRAHCQLSCIQALLERLLNPGGATDTKATSKPAGSKATSKAPAKAAVQPEAVPSSDAPAAPLPIDIIVAARLQLSQVCISHCPCSSNQLSQVDGCSRPLLSTTPGHGRAS